MRTEKPKCSYCQECDQESETRPGTCAKCGAPFQEETDSELLYRMAEEIKDVEPGYWG